MVYPVDLELNKRLTTWSSYFVSPAIISIKTAVVNPLYTRSLSLFHLIDPMLLRLYNIELYWIFQKMLYQYKSYCPSFVNNLQYLNNYFW